MACWPLPVNPGGSGVIEGVYAQVWYRTGELGSGLGRTAICRQMRPVTTERTAANNQPLSSLVKRQGLLSCTARAVVQLWSHERQRTIRRQLDERRHPEVEDPSGRLSVYLARTRTPLDLLALLTLWVVVVPYTDFGSKHHISTIALVVRIGVSAIYAIDMTVRATLPNVIFFTC